MQNFTIEERVSLLEIQVADIEGQITDLDQDVNFLFDDQIIQDERIFSLEEGSDEINNQLVVIDDDVESKYCYENFTAVYKYVYSLF